MLKRICAIISLLVIVIGIAVANAQPIFEKFSDFYEVYLSDASSLAEIKKVAKREYYLLRGVKGESVELTLEDFSLEKLLDTFDAVIKFTEQTSDSKIFYAYSPRIRFQKRVNGQRINLHVVVAKERVVVGSPLIFGSF